MSFSVLGFGGLSYPEFCQFAIDVDSVLKNTAKFSNDVALFKVNNKSKAAFLNWVTLWAEKHDLVLDIDTAKLEKSTGKLRPFEVLAKTDSAEHPEQTFLLTLRTAGYIAFKSGDLLAIPLDDKEEERFYSLAKVKKNTIVLSIKVHEHGRCSNMLNNLKIADKVSGFIVENSSFHLPKRTKDIVFIANGTGIGPFLGMLNAVKTTTRVSLYWGGRTQESFNLYHEFIQQSIDQRKLDSLNLAFSRTVHEKRYVQDLVLEDKEKIANVIKNKGCIMICGSTVMANAVVTCLSLIAQEYGLEDIASLKESGYIRIDSY